MVDERERLERRGGSDDTCPSGGDDIHDGGENVHDRNVPLREGENVELAEPFPDLRPDGRQHRAGSAGRAGRTGRAGRAGIDQRIAGHLRALRQERCFSIEDLAARSGVSRAMISKIECGLSSPTAVVLDKLAVGLNVLLPALLGYASRGPGRPFHPVTRRGDQPCWHDPLSGSRRRTLTPPGIAAPLQLFEIHLPPAARLAVDEAASVLSPQRQVWMLEGELLLHFGERTRRLTAGDCLAMTGGQPVMIHNPGTMVARYLLAAAP